MKLEEKDDNFLLTQNYDIIPFFFCLCVVFFVVSDIAVGPLCGGFVFTGKLIPEVEDGPVVFAGIVVDMGRWEAERPF